MTTPSLSPRGEATPSALQRVFDAAWPSPEYLDECDVPGRGWFAHGATRVSGDEIRAARAELSALLSSAQAARAKAIEDAAKVCEEAWAVGFWSTRTARFLADKIRALAAQDSGR